jgi:hypothetical protein
LLESGIDDDASFRLEIVTGMMDAPLDLGCQAALDLNSLRAGGLAGSEQGQSPHLPMCGRSLPACQQRRLLSGFR